MLMHNYAHAISLALPPSLPPPLFLSLSSNYKFYILETRVINSSYQLCLFVCLPSFLCLPSTLTFFKIHISWQKGSNLSNLDILFLLDLMPHDKPTSRSMDNCIQTNFRSYQSYKLPESCVVHQRAKSKAVFHRRGKFHDGLVKLKPFLGITHKVLTFHSLLYLP